MEWGSWQSRCQSDIQFLYQVICVNNISSALAMELCLSCTNPSIYLSKQLSKLTGKGEIKVYQQPGETSSILWDIWDIMTWNWRGCGGVGCRGWGGPLAIGGFPSHIIRLRPVMWSFDVYFLLTWTIFKQTSCQWCSCDIIVMFLGLLTGKAYETFF